MKNYTFYLITVLFNYLIVNTFAKNDYYLVSIRKNSKDSPYDLASVKEQDAIDEIVNDRMNDIYDIIAENKKTYITEDGTIDKKLHELEKVSNLRKRNEKTKLRFINKNRPDRNHKREVQSDDTDYIPFESYLVINICPITNYVVVAAYLSEEIVDKVKNLSNVFNCTKNPKLKINDDTTTTEETRVVQKSEQLVKYYNTEEILKETGWSGLTVQEQRNNLDYAGFHLSPVSQGVYNETSTLYDNYYYYPSSAGKDIDIYVLDSGLNGALFEEEFDDYKGTKDERVIQCDGEFQNGERKEPHGERLCYIGELDNDMLKNHGTLVSLLAVGTLSGSAKKANLHVLSVDLSGMDILVAFDYVIQNAKPHKTIVNLSLGCDEEDDKLCETIPVQDKLTEMVDRNLITIVSTGNDGRNRCNIPLFEGAEGVIPVGALAAPKINSMTNLYSIAKYSNYGECVSVFAPGTINSEKIYKGFSGAEARGTSFACPIASGVAATLMSEKPEIKYTYETMRELLEKLSIKGGIDNLPEGTPNRIINNGKRSIYTPPKCNDPNNNYTCGEQCCSSYGFCVDSKTKSESNYCLFENKCSQKNGFCTTNVCGANNNERHCLENECCSNGVCVNYDEDSQNQCFKENGCIDNYSDFKCLTYDTNKIDEYGDIKYKNKILEARCIKDLNTYKNKCDFTLDTMRRQKYSRELHDKICNTYKNTPCEQFFNSPFKFAPSCQQINYEYDLKPQTEENKAIQELYCAKKNKENYCFEDNLIFFDSSYSIAKIDAFQFCNNLVCYDKLLAFYKARIALMGKNPHSYRFQLKKYKNNTDALLSETCVNQISLLEKESVSTNVTSSIDNDNEDEIYGKIGKIITDRNANEEKPNSINHTNSISLSIILMILITSLLLH